MLSYTFCLSAHSCIVIKHMPKYYVILCNPFKLNPSLSRLHTACSLPMVKISMTQVTVTYFKLNGINECFELMM